ncbi:antA/AntB antirepressor family protein [Treponema denticola]|uniref:antA/AntB antirepressor family protein n=1 Tax=Treponema denticola TaxID=158 RepID=UPI0002B4F12E|nr:antA/AntB antirepressor family protein [Treponema denticola]EMB43563.1 hypothetical protein HMPREF9730_02376 [Treponema denticola AL-2]
MNELIKITEKGGDQLINARDLHEYLQVGRDFSNWIKDRIEKYRFVEGEDFFKHNEQVQKSFSPNLAKNRGRGRPEIDYFLTMDMAKELAIVENNEAGREIRRYLIKVEKKFREIALSGGDLNLIEVNSRLEWIERALGDLAEFKSAILKITSEPKVIEYRTINSQLDEDIYTFYKKHVDDSVPTAVYTKAIDVWDLFKYDTQAKYPKAEFLERFRAIYPQFTFEKNKNVGVFWGFRLVDTCGVC